jgi:hypothetical protein
LLRQERRIFAGGQSDHLEPGGMSIDDSQGAPPNRPGGSENGNPFHC